MLSKAVVMDRILRLEFLCTGHQQVSTRNGRLSFVYTEKISTLKAGSWFVPNILPKIALGGCSTWKESSGTGLWTAEMNFCRI